MASEKTKVCEFCGKSIAVHCPQCGGRFKRGDKLWLWTLIVLVLGIIVYFMLPINHVIDLKLIHEQESITNIKELAATPAYYAAMPDATGWLDVDQMIRDRSTVYEGQKLAVTGMILDVVYHDYVPYFRLIGTSGEELNMSVQVFFPVEYTSIYNLQYGDIVHVWIQCNEMAEFAYQCDLIAFE